MVNNNIIIKKTNELDDNEIKEILNLLNNIFFTEQKLIDKKINKEDFLRKYTSNDLQYSFHGMMKNKNKVKILYSVIPLKYKVFGRTHILGLAVDTLVEKEFRGNPFNLKKVANNVYDTLVKNNIYFIFGFPNKNILKIRERVLGWKKIGLLKNYYFINKLPQTGNKIYILAFLILKLLQRLCIFMYFPNNSEKNNNISLVDKERFKNFYNYQYLENKNFRCVYVIKEEKRILNYSKILYISYTSPLSLKNIILSIKEIIKIENDIKIIIFSSNIDSKFLFPLKIPNLLSFSKFEFYGKILDKNKINETILNNLNWELSLINTDHG